MAPLWVPRSWRQPFSMQWSFPNFRALALRSQRRGWFTFQTIPYSGLTTASANAGANGSRAFMRSRRPHLRQIRRCAELPTESYQIWFGSGWPKPISLKSRFAHELARTAAHWVGLSRSSRPNGRRGATAPFARRAGTIAPAPVAACHAGRTPLTRRPLRCGATPECPAFLALSARLAEIPEPGKATRPAGNASSI